MTTQINQLTELTSTSDGDLLLIRENATGVDKKMQAVNLRAKATTKDDVGLGDVDNVSAASLRDRSTHTGTQTLSTISDAGNMALQNKESVNIDGGNIDGTAVNATNLAYTGTLTGGTGVVNLGSGQVVKDASGNVGIGTSSPDTLLDVENSTAPKIRVGDGVRHVELRGGSTTQNPAVGTYYAGDLTFATDSTERMRIDSSGNVGVGTTSPISKLDVRGSQSTRPFAQNGKYLRDGSSGTTSMVRDLLQANLALTNWRMIVTVEVTASDAFGNAGISKFVTGVRRVSATITTSGITEISETTLTGTNPKATLSWDVVGNIATLKADNNNIFCSTMYEVTVAMYSDGSSGFDFVS